MSATELKEITVQTLGNLAHKPIETVLERQLGDSIKVSNPEIDSYDVDTRVDLHPAMAFARSLQSNGTFTFADLIGKTEAKLSREAYRKKDFDDFKAELAKMGLKLVTRSNG